MDCAASTSVHRNVSVQYSDREGHIDVHPGPETVGFVDGIYIVRGYPLLLEWAEQQTHAEGRIDGLREGSPAVTRLSEIAAGIAARADVERLRGYRLQRLGSVIPRPSTALREDAKQAEDYATNGYAGVVHRDLDETAVSNLQENGGTDLSYNVWVPLAAVESDPLALLLPTTVDLSDAAGYHISLEGDRTGLKHNAAHKWVWFPGLKPGDAIMWYSERVYHCAFRLPQQTAIRTSIDIRMYFSNA